MLERLGYSSTAFADDYAGVDPDDVARFKASLDLANDDGSLKQAEVIDAIKELQEEQAITNEAAYMLFHSRYDSDKNNPWRNAKP